MSGQLTDGEWGVVVVLDVAGRYLPRTTWASVPPEWQIIYNSSSTFSAIAWYRSVINACSWSRR
ncbi:hypothetical protein, partial [Roseiconus lacunae]